MKNRFIWTLIVVFVSGLFFTVSAQETYPSELLLEDIYMNRVFSQKGINSLSWMKDSKGYSTLEDNQDTGGKDLIRYVAKTGRREVLASASMLIPQGRKEPLAIREYTWSWDNEKLLIFTNTWRVWRYHTRGDYWVLDMKAGNLQQIGRNMDPPVYDNARHAWYW